MIAQLARIVGFFGFALALIHGIAVAVRGWNGQPLAAWETALLALLPLLLYVFLTRYSIFRKDCPSCAADRDFLDKSD